MAEIEETETALGEEEENYATLEEQYAQQIVEKEKKILELEISRGPAEREKSELVSKIDPKILPLYEKIFKKNGRGSCACRKRKMYQLQHKYPPSAIQRNTETAKADSVPELQENSLH